MRRWRPQIHSVAVLVLMAQHLGPLAAQASPVANEPSSTVTLKQAIDTAEANNSAVQQAAAQVRVMDAAVIQAKSATRLQITFNSTGSYSNAVINQPPPGGESFGTVQNSLVVPLPVGSKAFQLVKQAEFQELMAKAQLLAATQTLERSVASAYFDLLRQQSLLDAAKEEEATAAREEADTVERNSAGDVPQLDVMQAQVRAATARTEVLRAQGSAVVAQEALNDLMGQPLDQPTIASRDLSPAVAPTFTLEDARSAALRNSSDLAASNFAVLADRAAVDAARRVNDPQMSLQLDDVRSGDVTAFSREDTLQAAITVPLDDAGNGRAQIASAQAALAQSLAAEQTVRRSVIVAVSAAYADLQSSISEVQSAEAASNLAQTTYDKTRLGYQSGLYPLSDVLTAESSLTESRIEYIQSNYDASSAECSLELAVDGHILTSPTDPRSSAPGDNGR